MNLLIGWRCFREGSFSFLRAGLRCARTFRRYYEQEPVGAGDLPAVLADVNWELIELREQGTNEAESARETSWPQLLKLWNLHNLICNFMVVDKITKLL